MAKPATAISTPGRATLPWSRRPPVKRKKWHRSPSPNIELRERLEYAEPHMTALKLSLAFLSISLILPAQQWERDEDDDPAARQGWFYNQRAFPFASIPPGARRNASLDVDPMRPDTYPHPAIADSSVLADHMSRGVDRAPGSYRRAPGPPWRPA